MRVAIPCLLILFVVAFGGCSLFRGECALDDPARCSGDALSICKGKSDPTCHDPDTCRTQYAVELQSCPWDRPRCVDEGAGAVCHVRDLDTSACLVLLATDIDTLGAVGDVDGDGHADLVTIAGTAASLDGARYQVHLARGDGTFRSLAPVPSPLMAGMLLADFNGDGHADLAIGTFTDAPTPRDSKFQLSVRVGVGDGTFAVPLAIPQAGDQFQLVAVGDVNGDGIADAIGQDFSMRTLTVVLGSRDLAAAPAITSPACPTSASPICMPVTVSADFNGDGRADLVSVDEDWLYVLSGVPSGALSLGMAEGLGFRPQTFSVSAGDVDADGRPDLVLVHDKTASVLRGRGDGTFDTLMPLDVGPSPYSTQVAVVADVDHDGRRDLVMRDSLTPALIVRFGAAAGFGPPTYHDPTDDGVTPLAGIDTGGLILRSGLGRLSLN